MRNPYLVRTTVTDKRGRVTTVYRRPDSAGSTPVPPPPTPSVLPAHDEDTDELWERAEWVTPQLPALYAAVAEAEFANQNRSAKKRPTLRISDLADPKAAVNNCFDASSCVLRSGALSAIDAEAMLFTASDGDQQFHTAILLKAPTGEEAVLDFTARQFFPGAAFPLALTREGWEAFVGEMIEAWSFEEGA